MCCLRCRQQVKTAVTMSSRHSSDECWWRCYNEQWDNTTAPKIVSHHTPYKKRRTYAIRTQPWRRNHGYQTCQTWAAWYWINRSITKLYMNAWFCPCVDWSASSIMMVADAVAPTWNICKVTKYTGSYFTVTLVTVIWRSWRSVRDRMDCAL